MSTPAGQRPSSSPDDTLVIRAACERCGLFHDVRLRTMGSTDSLPDQVRPVCWVCGERPLATFTGTIERAKAS